MRRHKRVLGFAASSSCFPIGTMVWGLVQNFRTALKYRGGWKGLLEHMYTNGDFPFKVGTYKGCDPGGNRYYENRVDYPFGQHRWVEPGDIHNFDSSSIPPEYQGWMTSMNDDFPDSPEQYFSKAKEGIMPLESHSDAPYNDNVGHQEKIFNFHHMHNQSQVRSRGYGIGNPIVGLPPHAPDAYYTQPGSPYSESSIRKTEMIGDLGGDRPYKSLKWASRLRTSAEKAELLTKEAEEFQAQLSEAEKGKQRCMAALRSRGSGTVIGS